MTEFILRHRQRVKNIHAKSDSNSNGLVPTFSKTPTPPDILLTMTTCKRFDLFCKTIDSLLYAFQDLWMDVKELVVFDDNSSECDKIKMQSRYPWIKYIFKGPDDRGHARSLNMIRDYARDSECKYIVHIEDDFLFFDRDPTVFFRMRDILEERGIGQVMFNLNYTEVQRDMMETVGGEFAETANGTQYVKHEYVKTDQEIKAFTDKWHHLGWSSSNYWPHFSLRPFMMKVEVLVNRLPTFTEEKSVHFEMVQGYQFVELGYKTAFIPDVKHLHIGKLTHETGKNAYQLNQCPQFGGTDKVIHKCINLESRPDRWDACSKEFRKIGLYVERVAAVVGKDVVVTPQIAMLFEKNNFNFRSGIVGCALSHIGIWKDHVENGNQDVWLNVMEDDISNLDPELHYKLERISINNRCSNVVFWTHHAKNVEMHVGSDNIMSAGNALAFSYGGTAGYLISQQGCREMLAYIRKNSMTNAIDTVMQKSGLCSYTSEMLGSSPMCISGDIDSDIQNNFDCLDSSFDIQQEIAYLSKKLHCDIVLCNTTHEGGCEIHHLISREATTKAKATASASASASTSASNNCISWSYIARSNVMIELSNVPVEIRKVRPRSRI